MRRGRICSVRRVGNQHRASLCRSVSAVACIDEGANDHDASHLTVSAGRRLQGNAGQARDFGKMFLQLMNDSEGPLRIFVSAERMKIREAGNARHLFVETRIVLHRARTQRIHTLIDRIVPRGHSNEVPDYVDLADLWHTFKIVVSQELIWYQLLDRLFFDVERWQPITNAAGL